MKYFLKIIMPLLFVASFSSQGIGADIEADGGEVVLIDMGKQGIFLEFSIPDKYINVDQTLASPLTISIFLKGAEKPIYKEDTIESVISLKKFELEQGNYIIHLKIESYSVFKALAL